MSPVRHRLRAWNLPVIAWLTIVWLLLWGDVTRLNVVGGILVSALIVLVFPFPQVSVHGTVRPWRAIVLIAVFLYDLVVASFHVAWLAIRPKAPPASAVIRIELVSRSELLQVLTSELISLVPGSLLIELDSPGRQLWLHVLEADTPEQVAAARHHARMQEHRLLAAFGSREEYDESTRLLEVTR